MDTNTENDIVRVRAPYTRTWEPTLVRTTAPHWGPPEREAVLQALSAYHDVLLATPRALGALDGNGIKREVIEAFHLGFATRIAGKRLPSGETYEGALLRGRLQNVGLYRLSGHSHFHGAIVAPVFDLDGRVVEVYGRKITPKLRAGAAYHLSLYDPPQGVFNLKGLVKSDEVVLCGDLFDALAFYSAGVRNVTTMVGPRGFTDGHLRAFAAFGIRRVVIALPAGKADDRISRLIAQALDYLDIECARVSLPKEVGNPGLLPELVCTAAAFQQSAEALLKEARA